MNYDHEIIDPHVRTHRLRTNVGVSAYVGIVVETRRHESNKRPMYRLAFGNPKHQAVWGGAWFYFDDLEAVV